MSCVVGPRPLDGRGVCCWFPGWGWGGVGMVTFGVLAHMFDATQLYLRTCWMLRNYTCTHVGCYVIVLAHMLDATQLYLRTCWMLRNYTCTHVACYAIVLVHMFDATQLYLRTCSMLRHCTCAHVGCYAIVLAHMFDATQLYLRTCSMLRNCTWKNSKSCCDKKKTVWKHVNCTPNYQFRLGKMTVFELLLVNQGLNNEKNVWNQFLMVFAHELSSMIRRDHKNPTAM